MAPGVCILEVVNGESSEEDSHKPLVVKERTATSNIEQRDFRPADDYLFIRQAGWNDFTFLLRRSATNAPWIADVKHLAIEASNADANNTFALSLDLPYLPGLETISFVFPQSRGTMDVFSGVELSEEQEEAPVFRKLSRRELQSIRLQADYEYDTWHSSHRVTWKTTGDKFIDAAFDCMVDELKKDDWKPYPACWNASTKKLSLRYEGVCFAGS